MKYLLVLFLLLNFLVCSAAIYKQLDANGNIIYSDHLINKTGKVTIIELEENNFASTTSSPPPAPKQVITKEESAPHVYNIFTIESPQDQQTFQNQRNIPVAVQVDPALKPGDKIQLLLDGNPWGEAQESTQLTLAEVSRGSHQVSAVIISANQQILKRSNVVTIFVHLASILNRPQNQ